MPQCYRCNTSVKSTDVKCPNCRAELKAFGHAGIDLHRATGTESLCLSCAYHADDSCDYAKRPNAKDCTLYRNVNQPVAPIRRPGARPPGNPIVIPTIVAVILVLLLIAIVMR
jgi:ribosomal protein S27E